MMAINVLMYDDYELIIVQKSLTGRISAGKIIMPLEILGLKDEN